jgi:hypothetical protein
MAGAAAVEARWFSLKQRDPIRLNPATTAGETQRRTEEAPDSGQRKHPAADAVEATDGRKNLIDPSGGDR